MNRKKDVFLCIDIGGTKTSFMLIDQDDKRLFYQKIPTYGKQGIEALAKRIFDELQSESENYKILEIAISCPGPLDLINGRIINVATTGWKNVPIVHIFEKQFGVGALLINDCTAAVLGEYHYGAGRGYQNILYMSVSTGIGGGIVMNGQVYEGKSGNSAEFGHISIERDGKVCKCGNVDCLELYASGSAIEKIYYTLTGNRMTARDIAEAAKSGDVVAKKVYEEAGTCLGIAINNLNKTFDFEAIILGGGVMESYELLEPSVKEVLEIRNGTDIQIKLQQLGGKQGLYGAGYYMRQERIKRNSVNHCVETGNKVWEQAL